MNINLDKRLAALVHDIEGDQPPPLDHYRYEVSTLPNGQSCITLYGPEGHESNALTWYQQRGVEPSFPDAWRYVVEALTINYELEIARYNCNEFGYPDWLTRTYIQCDTMADVVKRIKRERELNGASGLYFTHRVCKYIWCGGRLMNCDSR